MTLALFRQSLDVDLNWLKIVSESVSVTEGRKLVSVYVVVVVYEHMGNVCSLDDLKDMLKILSKWQVQ